METIDPQLISIRDLREEDIPIVLDYWFRSPPGFIESLGADPAKFPSEPDMERALRDKCRADPAKLNALVITYAGRTIGYHTLMPVTVGESGVFHAHVFDPAMRHRGLALHTYPRACRIFMDRFELPRILFKTPLHNSGALRIKEKLGIRAIGEESVSFGVYRPDTKTKVFELLRGELDALTAGAPPP